MFNKNFLSAFLKSINSGKNYPIKTYLGESTVNYNLSDIFNRDPGIGKDGGMTNNHFLGFRFGNGTADESIDDICLAVDPTLPVSESNLSTRLDDDEYFSVSAAGRTTSSNNEVSYYQIWTYSEEATEVKTISEICMVHRYIRETQMTMYSRKKIPSFDVHPNESFMISQTIGGKVTVEKVES